MSMQGAPKRGQIEALQASTSALRVKVDALLNAPEAPKSVVEATMAELRVMIAEMKPLSAVATEFRNRWRKQKTELLEKRKAEVEHHLRTASNAQLARMEAEADDKITAMNQEYLERQKKAVNEIHRHHETEISKIIDDWRSEVAKSDHVKDSMVQDAIAEAIGRIKVWALKEETRIMSFWEEQLSNMMLRVNSLDESEIQAMEDSRLTRCRLVESAVERQQQELVDFRNAKQDLSLSLFQKINRSKQPDESKTQNIAAGKKKEPRTRAVAKREVEQACQLHVESALKYLDEAAALEKARVNAYHATMREIGPELEELLKEDLAKKTEDAGSSKSSYNNWGPGGATASGLPGTFSTARQQAGQTPVQSTSTHVMLHDEDDNNEATKLINEVAGLREKARQMMAAVGRGDWRKDILEVAEEAIDGLRRTEMALAQGPLQSTTAAKSARDTKELLSTIESHARQFSENVLKEFTRMRNIKVALSCSRSKHVREAMQQYEVNSAEIEDAIMPTVSKLAHEVEVIREVVNASKYGEQKMPLYIIASSWRRALVAAYPALKRLWEAADVPESERKNFIRKIVLHIAVEPAVAPLFQAETSALEATLPAPDWAVTM